ncbi:MAG TPA: 23S rRNA (uracil(1939)-C(5))-methyltransferase RlmD [Myxococcales bacterium]|nr:23S rRNA (uracil(1939)-C(5))-methyltransferase RlmD [Myxococcales bacterium]HIN84924.1 23S rRNA (uracil(1939)-C(5))-methyltransferase RlmD [Myxococcales bacterium]
MSHKGRRATREQDSYTVGSIHEVQVEPLDGHPAAPARDTKGRAFRVTNATPGDRLEVEIVARGRKDIWSQIRTILQPGPHRVDAPCDIVDRCGGCPWQSTRYREQLRAKGHILRAAICAKHETAVVHDPIGISPPVGYRTKIQMPFGGEAGNLKAGFYMPRTHELVHANHCPVQHPLAEKIRPQIIKLLNHHQIAPYNETTGQGELRTILMRIAEGTGEIGVVLVVRSIAAFDWAVLAAELTAIPDLTGVWLNENSSTGNAVLGSRTVHLSGARRLNDRIGGIAFQRNPMAFFQTNHRATEKLLEIVAEMLPEQMTTLFDLYAGGGLFAAALGGRAKQLHLVESHPDAVAAARATLRDAGLDHAHIHLGRSEEILPTLNADGIAADAVIVDPPRSGIDPKAISAIVKFAPQAIIYVSCNQRSLLRDLAEFKRLGFRLIEVKAVDMFPHTPHVETISLLTP